MHSHSYAITHYGPLMALPVSAPVNNGQRAVGIGGLRLVPGDGYL